MDETSLLILCTSAKKTVWFEIFIILIKIYQKWKVLMNCGKIFSDPCRTSEIKAFSRWFFSDLGKSNRKLSKSAHADIFNQKLTFWWFSMIIKFVCALCPIRFRKWAMPKNLLSKYLRMSFLIFSFPRIHAVIPFVNLVSEMWIIV